MLKLSQEIIIYEGQTGAAKLRFPYLAECTITTSRLTFTDTCTVTIPQKLKRVSRKISDTINVNDRIVVKLGYNNELETQFDGYISKIKPLEAMELTCEDRSFLLKQDVIGESFTLRKTDLKTLITRIYDGQTQIGNAEIGDWQVNENATVVDVFDELQKKLKILCYFQDDILYVNYEFEKTPEKTVLFDTEQNVPAGSNNLNITKADEVKPISHGLSKQKDGSKIEVFSYYATDNNFSITTTTTRPSGVLNTLKIPKLTQAQLTKLTERRLPQLYYKGVTGDIGTFGQPSLKHGDRAAIRDNSNPDLNGIYDIIEITKTFGVSSGYKQACKLGRKLADYS